MELTHKQMSARGGKNRWKKVPKKARSAEMAKVAQSRWGKEAA